MLFTHLIFEYLKLLIQIWQAAIIEEKHDYSFSLESCTCVVANLFAGGHVTFCLADARKDLHPLCMIVLQCTYFRLCSAYQIWL